LAVLSVRRAHSIEEVLKQSDFVTLHVPLLAVTRNLLDAKRFAVMKAGAVLLNFARDGIVNEEAVAAALQSQRLKAYLCDFPSPRLLREPHVVALPHLGASTMEAEENCAVMVVDRCAGVPDGAVNFSNVEMPRESPYRVAIASANVEHAGPDLDDDGARETQHPQHGEQVARRNGVRWSTSTVRSTMRSSPRWRRSDGVLSVRAIPRALRRLQ
jgi:hypothetical protein